MLALKMQMEMSYVFAVVITGLVVVFLGLILLILFIKLIGWVFGKIEGRKKPGGSAPPPENKPKPVQTQNVPAPSGTDDSEVIAVIAAAVAAMAEADGTAYRVKSVKAAAPSRSAWAAAGLRETTNPF